VLWQIYVIQTAALPAPDRQERTDLADIFQEIDEELRRDRWENVWKKYGKYVLGIAAVIVLGTAGWVGWQEYQLRQNLSVTNAMHAGLAAAQAGNDEEAIEAFAAVTTQGNDRQNTLALLQEAALRAKSGDVETARGLYQSIRENDGLDEPYRALAAIRAIELDLDTGDAGTMLGWLTPLMADGSEWRFAAWELGAYLENRLGNADAAKGLWERLRDDPDSPVSARARAEAYLAQL
jgi:hypothetical protein